MSVGECDLTHTHLANYLLSTYQPYELAWFETFGKLTQSNDFVFDVVTVANKCRNSHMLCSVVCAVYRVSLPLF